MPYIVDSVDERVDTAVAHGQDVAPHPHIVYASEAGTFELVSVLHTYAEDAEDMVTNTAPE